MEFNNLINDFIKSFASISALFTGVIAWNTYQQRITNNNKLRLDLYNIRFKIYIEIKELLYHIKTDAILTLDLDKLNNLIRDSHFIFDDNIIYCLKEIYKKVEELQKILLPSDPIFPNNKFMNCIQVPGERNYELTIWLSEQYKIIDKIFDEYLSFKNII